MRFVTVTLSNDRFFLSSRIQMLREIRQFRLRLGRHPRCVVATTPRPTRLVTSSAPGTATVRNRDSQVGHYEARSLLLTAMTFSRRAMYSPRASSRTNVLLSEGIAVKSKLSRLF